MIKLDGLRLLHSRMRGLNLQKVIFPYRVNNALFTVMFSTIGKPFELALTANADNLFILREVLPGYRVSTSLENETYLTLANLLRTHGRSGNKLIPANFLGELNEYLARAGFQVREPSPVEILQVRHDLPERELPYFWHWIDQDVRHRGVSQKNLAKTRLILGTEAEAFSQRNNLSSRWTDNARKARNWRPT